MGAPNMPSKIMGVSGEPMIGPLHKVPETILFT